MKDCAALEQCEIGEVAPTSFGYQIHVKQDCLFSEAYPLEKCALPGQYFHGDVRMFF